MMTPVASFPATPARMATMMPPGIPTIKPSMKRAINRTQNPALGALAADDPLACIRTPPRFGASITPLSVQKRALDERAIKSMHAPSCALRRGKPSGPVDPAADWQHPADPDQAAGKGVPAHHLLCQGRMVQPGRLGQGPAGAADDRGGRPDRL